MLEELTNLLCQDYGGLAVILGFVVSVIYLLTVLSIENKIDLHENDYHIKLVGFAIGRSYYLCNLFL